MSSTTYANLDLCEPRLTVSLRPGFVRLCCETNGAPAYRVQTRLRGESWVNLLDYCESRHINDHTPATYPGREEIREYRAIALCDGEEVGFPSEVVTVAIPG
jgi:hypothetical protein